MRRFLKLFASTIIIALLLSACSEITLEEHEFLKKEYNDNLATLNNTKSELDSAKSKLSAMQEQIAALEDERAEFQELRDKYQNLSDSEILVQTEANALQAEKDRQARELLLAQEKAKQQKLEADRKAAEEAEIKKGYNTGISFEQLARSPDDYKEKKVKFKGKVIQVMEGDLENQLRIAVNSNYNNVILVYYRKSIVSKRILEDDIVTLYGVSKGLYTYKSTMGGYITIPLIEVDKFDQ